MRDNFKRLKSHYATLFLFLFHTLLGSLKDQKDGWLAQVNLRET